MEEPRQELPKPKLPSNGRLTFANKNPSPPPLVITRVIDLGDLPKESLPSLNEQFKNHEFNKNMK